MRSSANVALLLTLFATPTVAATVRVTANQDEIVHQRGSSVAPTITLQLVNLVVGETPEILIWQLGLDIVPRPTAIGTLDFSAAEKPVDYLFPDPAKPIPSTLALPSLDAGGSSATLFPISQGVLLTEDIPRNILSLEFAVSSDAAGVFDIVLAPFASDFSRTSYWTSELIVNPADFSEFENAQVGSDTTTRTVASIRVVVVPEPQSWTTLVLGLTIWSLFSSHRPR